MAANVCKGVGQQWCHLKHYLACMVLNPVLTGKCQLRIHVCGCPTDPTRTNGTSLGTVVSICHRTAARVPRRFTAWGTSLAVCPTCPVWR